MNTVDYKKKMAEKRTELDEDKKGYSNGFKVTSVDICSDEYSKALELHFFGKAGKYRIEFKNLN